MYFAWRRPQLFWKVVSRWINRGHSRSSFRRADGKRWYFSCRISTVIKFKFCLLLRKILYPTGFNYRLLKNYELSYKPWSHGMGRHRDLVMTTPFQIEASLTIREGGESMFVWMDSKRVQHKVRPERDSLILVKPALASHWVTPFKNETRSFIKYIFMPRNAIKLRSYQREYTYCPKKDSYVSNY